MKRRDSGSPSSAFLKIDGGKTKSNAIETPSLSLPKGGGAIKGIDEKFSVNAVNGTASFTIPLPFSPARGVSPSLNLTYSSGGGNGTFGLGWSLGLASIKRKTENELPRYQDGFDSDTFLFSEAEDLVPEFEKELDGSLKLDAGGDYVIREGDSSDAAFTIRFYKPRIEGQFTRIERWTNKTAGEIKWRVVTKENVTTLFGWTTASRISDPKNANKTFTWLPEFVFDDKGNCARYLYKKEDDAGFNPAQLHNRNRFANGDITYTNTYLAKILYGNKTPYKVFGDPFPLAADFMFETVFDFGEYNASAPFDEAGNWTFRQDAFSSYKAGFDIRTTRLCKRVLLFHHFAELPGGSALVRSIDLEYETGPAFTFLKSVTSRGYIKRADGSYTSKAMPSTEFGYQTPDWNKEIKIVARENLVHSPAGLADSSYQFTDLFNEGLSGILTEKANGWYYKHNLGGGVFEHAKLISPKPSFTGLGRGGTLQLADLDADGCKQIVNYNSEPRGFFELNDENEWLPFRGFAALPNINLHDPNTRLLDLSGDGMADALITEDAVFTWYQSAGREGFLPARTVAKQTDEETGPHVVFAEARQTIFLADMTGDGLTDLVRIRNGEVCYWPNLGFGNFGAKIVMDNSPVFDHPDVFNPALIHLADIDGSGTPDIIYLGKDKFSCWMNLSGNGYDAVPFEIDTVPGLASSSHVDVVDLFGNGVQCIVFSSDLEKDAAAPLQVIDLMNGKKPHVMVGYQNNMGKEVSFEYAPSTRFYIEDKLSGRPWITKLHFPVHCVVKTETRDRISGYRFVTSYKYHHGYYDHAEKEFRGFGMIEQTDTEHFDHWVKGTASNIVAQELHQAPVLTKSWFHTGAFLSLKRILEQFAGEYWYEEMQRLGHTVVNHEVPLPDARLITAPGLDPNLIDHLSAQEWREALRACKGMSLRVETFAKDAPLSGPTPDELKRELTPFSSATHNCVIELIQPKGRNKHAVYVVKESEAVSYSYERVTDDPRITHTLNIKFDEYASVLEAAAVVYPRLNPDAGLPSETQEAQARTLISYVRTTFTGDITTQDDYRLRRPSEVETFELKGVAKSGALYAIDDFDGILAASTDAHYHEIDLEPAAGTSQKRLIEHQRTLFYASDLSGPLQLHELSRHGLSFENYLLAYTPDLLTDIFGTKVDAPLMLEGKFTHSEGDNKWWIRSGSMQFIEGAETVADAANRFYLPLSYTDPFGAKTRVKYFSNYFFFVEETEDALQNKATVLSFNMRTLAPQRLRDANGNISEVISDELSLVKASALFGKGAEADDLAGLNEFTTAEESTLINDFFNAADSVQLVAAGKNLLQHATTRFVYDLDAYRNSGGTRPVVTASIVRETHFNDDPNSPVHLAFEYSNGLGHSVMKKVQAEPGLAKSVTINPDDTYTVTDVDTSASVPKQLRWVGNGRMVLNNKGHVVKQFEPYFSVTHKYEDLKELVETGATVIFYYDAVGRMIKKEFPDSTISKTEFDSWKQINFDQNDTVKDTRWYDDRFNHLIDAELIAAGKDPAREKLAAEKAGKHHGTPSLQHFDTLGRPVLLVEHNKDGANDVFLQTRINLDVEGNLRHIVDARNNAFMNYKYSMLGVMVYQDSKDAGQRWTIQNIMGNLLRNWDERNHVHSVEYDVLHRAIAKQVTGGDGPTPLNNIYEKTIYGETLPNPAVNNFRTRPVVIYDLSGKAETLGFDFKGNPTATVKTFALNYKETVDWSGPNPDALLESESFSASFEYDALNRVTQQTAPDGSVYHPAYNEANLLDSVQVTQNATTEFFVRNINYNEKGQRSRITYGNNVTTNYFYDKETFRLIRLETKRQNNDPLQDLYYTFDAAGNVTHIEDKNIPEVFFDNQKITGVSSFTYDALYRLIEATGREHAGQVDFGPADNWHDLPFLKKYNPGDTLAWRAYTQSYQYDAVGNILQLHHDAGVGTWTRDYAYESSNNRLKTTQIDAETYTYAHHAQHGFMTAMPHLPVMNWNFRDELQAVAQQKRNDGGTPETTYYVYDSAGERVRKVTENAANPGVTPTRKTERLYIGGIEIYREHSGVNSGLERVSLHVMDDTRRVAMIETRNAVDDGTPVRTVRYQFGNHLGSAALELNELAELISYEEYHPYGTTSYEATRNQTQAPKRYRFTGKERDEESGFYYHGARYYVPWLARWTATDPEGVVDGPCVYQYCRGNPLSLHDPTGTQGKAPVPGLITNEAAVGKLWEQAVVETLGARFGAKSYQEVIKGFEGELSKRIAAKGMGSNKAAGTGINFARESYAAVRTRFGELAVAKGISLDGVQVHHTFDELAKNPTKALETTNLSFQKGHAGKKGSGHNFAHEVNKAREAKISNPGKHTADQMRAAGTKPDVPELGPAHTTPSHAPAPHTGTPHTGTPHTGTPHVGTPHAGTPHVSAPHVKAPHVKAPHAPKKVGGGTIGKVVAVGLALYVYFDTGSAYAAAQTANPAANTTEQLLSGSPTAKGVAKAVVQDIYEFTPVATAQFAIETVGPWGKEFRYDPKLAEKAIQEGRNPFCAQCHGPGGALDPNNEHNQRAQEARFARMREMFSEADTRAMMEMMAAQKK